MLQDFFQLLVEIHTQALNYSPEQCLGVNTVLLLDERVHVVWYSWVIKAPGCVCKPCYSQTLKVDVPMAKQAETTNSAVQDPS